MGLGIKKLLRNNLTPLGVGKELLKEFRDKYRLKVKVGNIPISLELEDKSTGESADRGFVDALDSRQ